MLQNQHKRIVLITTPSRTQYTICSTGYYQKSVSTRYNRHTNFGSFNRTLSCCFRHISLGQRARQLCREHPQQGCTTVRKPAVPCTLRRTGRRRSTDCTGQTLTHPLQSSFYCSPQTQLVILSFHEMPSILLCHLWCAASRLFVNVAVNGHTSAPYRRVDRMIALYSLVFTFRLTLLLPNTVREYYFACSSLKELFENVDATTIMDFMKQVNFYHLV